MDLDLYEGTVDGLKFINKCDWERIVIRFDDWGLVGIGIKSDVDEHEKAAFYEWISETKYKYYIDPNYLQKTGGRQSLIHINRKKFNINI